MTHAKLVVPAVALAGCGGGPMRRSAALVTAEARQAVSGMTCDAAAYRNMRRFASERHTFLTTRLGM